MEMIKQNEGFKNKPYQDTKNLWTVGVGHLIGDGKTLPPEWDRTFSNVEIDQLFALDFWAHKKLAEKSPGWDKANSKAKAGIIDLTFNMGGGWYNKFKNAAAAMAAGDWQTAANELKFKDATKTQLSNWYTQVKGRAERTTALIAAGGAPQTGTQIAQQSAAVGAVKTDMKREQQNDVTVVAINETNRRRVTL
jgi:GH24 family phage-related lysozyme (muramidase)